VQRWAVTKARMARRGGGIGERSRDREESVGVSMMRNVAADTKHTYIFEPIYGFTCLKVVLVGGPHAALPHACRYAVLSAAMLHSGSCNE
jgi:hypothetical protein